MVVLGDVYFTPIKFEECFYLVFQPLFTNSESRVSVLFQAIRPQQEWNMLHHIGGRACSCTCLAVSSSSSEAVTAGEDGQINFLKLDQRHPVRTIGKNSFKPSSSLSPPFKQSKYVYPSL